MYSVLAWISKKKGNVNFIHDVDQSQRYQLRSLAYLRLELSLGRKLHIVDHEQKHDMAYESPQSSEFSLDPRDRRNVTFLGPIRVGCLNDIDSY